MTSRAPRVTCHARLSGEAVPPSTSYIEVATGGAYPALLLDAARAQSVADGMEEHAPLLPTLYGHYVGATGMTAITVAVNNQREFVRELRECVASVALFSSVCRSHAVSEVPVLDAGVPATSLTDAAHAVGWCGAAASILAHTQFGGYSFATGPMRLRRSGTQLVVPTADVRRVMASELSLSAEAIDQTLARIADGVETRP